MRQGFKPLPESGHNLKYIQLQNKTTGGLETGFFREYFVTAQRLGKNPVSLTECVNFDRPQCHQSSKSPKSSIPARIAKSAIGVASFEVKSLVDAKNWAIARLALIVIVRRGFKPPSHSASRLKTTEKELDNTIGCWFR